MPGKDLFEYAVIRVVPRVEREEAINAGVIVYCAKQRFLNAAIHLDAARIAALHNDADIAAIQQHLHSFRRICCGAPDSGTIARLDAASRFRWLTAMRSTVVQTSRVHPGLCDDAAAELEKLFQRLVL